MFIFVFLHLLRYHFTGIFVSGVITESHVKIKSTWVGTQRILQG